MANLTSSSTKRKISTLQNRSKRDKGRSTNETARVILLTPPSEMPQAKEDKLRDPAKETSAFDFALAAIASESVSAAAMLLREERDAAVELIAEQLRLMDWDLSGRDAHMAVMCQVHDLINRAMELDEGFRDWNWTREHGQVEP